MLKTLKLIANKVLNKSNAAYSMCIKEQEKYLNSLPEPENNIERSYFQFLCQKKLMGKRYIIINLFSLPLLLYYYFFKKNYKKYLEQRYVDCHEAVFIKFENYQDIVPSELRFEFKRIETEVNYIDYFTNEDKLFFSALFHKYPTSWLFLLKSLIKIRLYSGIINFYNPKAIIVCSEYSFTSSLLTEYCEKHGIEHIDIQHGEKFFFIRDTFFYFHRMYVWDVFYKDLFIKLRAESSQFRIAIPKSLDFQNGNKVTRKYDFTYYLANEDNSTLLNIAHNMNRLIEKGYIVTVRPHPRYSSITVIKTLFRGIEIEDNTISIECSILRTNNAVGLSTTVLYQAFNNGTAVVIDDISNINNYKMLKETDYIMLNKKHVLLSNIV